MDTYLLLRFLHFVGFVCIGGGLLAVFVSELRAYRTRDPAVFAEAAWYTARFYDAVVLPGAALVALSGLLLIYELGLGYFSEPWLVGRWGLFLFEFLEGNTVTRIQFRRTLRRSQEIRHNAALSDIDRERARTPLGQVAHFLDLPLFLAMVYFGVTRPDSRAAVLATTGVAVAAAVLLTLTVPRLAAPPALEDSRI